MRIGIVAGLCALAACSGGASNLVGPELFTYTAATRVTIDHSDAVRDDDDTQERDD